MELDRKLNLNLICNESNSWKLKEDYLSESSKKSVVDGKNILAVVEGVFFVPNGVSRNERYYPEKLWRTVLERNSVKEKLTSKTMFGCVGHSDRGVTEDDLTEGKVSHIVTKLWIDENSGMGLGQVYILGTPAGKNLYIYMKAGSNIKVSSRAAGDYKQDEDYNGMPIVDENTYFLETFDFVINPGFLETNPMLKESVDKIKKDMAKMEMKEIGEKPMAEFGKELVEHVQADNKALTTKLEESIAKNAILEDKSKNFEKVSEELEAVSGELEAVKAELEEVKPATEKVAELEEALKEATEKAQAYADVCEGASPEELAETIKKSTELIEGYAKTDVKKLMEDLEEAEAKNKKYEEFGTIEEFETVLPVVHETLDKISEHGTLSEVLEIIERASALTESIENEKFEDLAIKISRAHKAPVENVKKLLEAVGEAQTTKILESVSKQNKKIITEKIADTKAEIQEAIEEKATEQVQESYVSDIFRRIMR